MLAAPGPNIIHAENTAMQLACPASTSCSILLHGQESGEGKKRKSAHENAVDMQNVFCSEKRKSKRGKIRKEPERHPLTTKEQEKKKQKKQRPAANSYISPFPSVSLFLGENKDRKGEVEKKDNPTLLLLGLPHPRIDSGTKRRKGHTPPGHGLRPRILGQEPPRQTPGRDAVAEIVLGPQALDAALDAGEEGADFAKVFGHGEGTSAHVFEAVFELLAEGHGGERLAGAVGEGGAEGGVVGHLWGVS